MASKRLWSMLILTAIIALSAAVGLSDFSGGVFLFIILGVIFMMGWLSVTYRTQFAGKKFPKRFQPKTHSGPSAFRSGGWENTFLLIGLVIAGYTLFYRVIPGFATPFIILGITLLVYGLEKLRQKRMIINIPTSKVRSAAVGLVELQGSVASSDEALLTSPLMGRKCVHYTTKVEEYKQSGKKSRWKTIWEDGGGEYVYLDDGTGSILVHLDKPEFDLDKDLHVTTRHPKNENIKKFCERVNLRIGSGWFAPKRRYSEIIIEPDDSLYVLGTAKINPEAEKTGSKLVVSRGDEEKVFLVSEHGQESLLKKYGWKSGLAVWGGAASLVVGIVLALL